MTSLSPLHTIGNQIGEVRKGVERRVTRILRVYVRTLIDPQELIGRHLEEPLRLLVELFPDLFTRHLHVLVLIRQPIGASID